MSFKIITEYDKINKDKWKSLLNKSPFASPFQSPEFYNFFNSVSGLSANVYAIENDHELIALCVVSIQKEKGIKGYFSRRGIIYGGPLLGEGENGMDALEALIAVINNDLKNKLIYAEARNFNDYSYYKDCFKKNGWLYHSYLNFHLDISNEVKALNNFTTNRKRQIKKAIDSGVQLCEAKNEEEVKSFYNILQKLYRSKIKKPLLPYDFFILFFKNKLGKYLLVRYHDKIIGGIMCPILKGKVIYEFYICGLDHEYKEACPSVMATYSAIEYGFKHGIRRFDFMGAGKPKEEYGVREFKAKFGGELVEHGRFIKVYNESLYKLGKTGISILKNIKLK